MKEHPILRLLRPIAQREVWRRAAFSLAATWAIAAVAAALLLQAGRHLGIPPLASILAVAVLGLIAGLITFVRALRVPPDLQRTAQTIEAAHPDLNGLLVTTLQQQPGPDGRFSFIQSLALDQALDHARRNTWSRLFPTHRILAAVALQGVAFLAFVAVLVFSPRTPVPPSETAKSTRIPPKVVDGLEVTPGNTELEKGSSLVVLARFGNAPRNADLVVLATNKPEQRIALVRNLADPVFGGAVSDVTNHFDYRVESDAGSSELFHVTVFEYPRLDRSIADITYPDYTQRPKKHIEDTRRVTAVEGSTLDLTLQLNKPVTRAVLQPAGTNLAPIVLATPSNQPIASLAGHVLTTGGTYNLRLVDADGRTNRVSAQFVFEVPPNRPPELKLALPRGDIRPSALEELQFDGTVWDDFGILRYGLGFIRVGADPDLVELGATVPGNERRPFAHQLRLEELNAQPDQVFGWFVWAEDTGPDGQVRRTSGDIFFGEVRPFEEIFREGEGSGEQQGEQQGESQGNNSPATKLAQLQKQIISATWKLQSRKPSTNAPKTSATLPPVPRISPIRPIRPISPLTLAHHSGIFAQPARLQPSQPPAQRRPRPAAPSTASYADDLKVVRQAAEDALDQASSSMEEENDPAKRALWTDAITQMERSIELLDKAAKDPTLLKDALAAEQAAYQTILKLQPRESEVTRRRNQQSQSQSQSDNQRNQEQIDELDLTQSENRYETQSQARSPQDEQQREQQQAINRLEELARRQEEMNKRLKELQTALQAADEKKKEELQHELKRLQEEQRQNLADADELQQRMEQPGNQSAMSEQRQQLEQTREDMQKAAEATGEGQVSQALASGTRAQRQLEEIREELRRQNASELNEAARELRAEARDIARAQEEIKRELDAQQNGANKGQKSLEGPTGREKLLEKLTAQQSRLTNLVQRATDLSQKAEGSEPLLSKQLYDTLREVSQEDTTNLKQMREQLLREGQLTRGLRDRLKDSEDSNAKSLEVTRELLRQGLDQPAREAEQRARKNIDTLRQGVEKAANSVLGDDTEALRFAQQELDNAARQLSQEIAQAQPQPSSEAPEGSVRSVGSVGSPPTPTQEPGQPGEPTQPGQQTGEPQEPGQPSQQPGQQPGEPRQPGQQPGQPGQQPGERGQPGQQPGQPTEPPEPRQPGQQPGQPSQPNQPGQPGQQPGTPSQQPAQQPAQQPGQQQGQQPASQPGQGSGRNPSQQPTPPSPNPQDTPGAPSINDSLQSLLPGSRPRGAQTPSGGEARPLTGNDFTQWSDRLRDVEQLIDSQDLRSEVANARDQARRARIEFNRSKTKPDWAQIELQVLKPLVEVRDQIREELARRASQDPLVPLDRDPVPGRYSELVRRYYEELGKDK